MNTKLAGKSDTSHIHKYAGSSSAGGSANSAVKLDTTTAGSATQPCYFSGGKPVKCTYTLGKSVPSNAVFTDTIPSYTSGNFKSESTVKSVEWARYIKWGRVVSVDAQFNSGTVSGNETVLFSGVPAPAMYIRAVALAINGSNYYPIRLGIDESGRIANAYTDISKLSNCNIYLHATYISAS